MENNYFDNQRKNILSNVSFEMEKKLHQHPFSKEKINKGMEGEGAGEEKAMKVPPDEPNENEKIESEKATPEQIEKLKQFIKKNNYLDDTAFHLYATEIGLSSSEAEEAIYQILHDTFSEERINKILDGKSKNYTPEEIAEKHGISMKQLQKQINIGVQVEKEHTKDEATALTITLDHLVEQGDYYTGKKPKNWGEKEVEKKKEGEKKVEEKPKTEEEESEEVKKAIIAEKGELLEKAYADGTRVQLKNNWYIKKGEVWRKERNEIELYSYNLSKAIQFDKEGKIKLTKEQKERFDKLNEKEIEKFFTVLTGINKPETLEAFKKLPKEDKVNALAFYIAKQGKNRSEDIEKVLKPHEGELRHFSDGDYMYTGGHWKKVKI